MKKLNQPTLYLTHFYFVIQNLINETKKNGIKPSKFNYA